jgi:CheY-like chemotaxis protein
MTSEAVVLIVEDEPLVLEVARAEFEDAGYAVLTASDSDEALSLLESGTKLDLLFTDIRMPGSLDGWGVAERARALRPGLPVIYATGFSSQAPQVVEGALMFTKPYRLQDIISAADRLR